MKIHPKLYDDYVQLNKTDEIIFNMRFYDYTQRTVHKVNYLYVNRNFTYFIPIANTNDEHLRGRLTLEKYHIEEKFYSINFFNNNDVILIDNETHGQLYFDLLKKCQKHNSNLSAITFINKQNKIASFILDDVISYSSIKFIKQTDLNLKAQQLFEILQWFLYWYNTDSFMKFSNKFEKQQNNKFFQLKQLASNIIDVTEYKEFSYENVLGINGIKNKIHMKLHNMLVEGNFQELGRLKAFFNNVKYAFERIKSF